MTFFVKKKAKNDVKCHYRFNLLTILQQSSKIKSVKNIYGDAVQFGTAIAMVVQNATRAAQGLMRFAEHAVCKVLVLFLSG